MAKNNYHLLILAGLAVAFLIIIFGKDHDMTTQSVQQPGCTNACASDYNQKPAPDCSCYKDSLISTVSDAKVVTNNTNSGDTNFIFIDVSNTCVDHDGGAYPYTLGTTTEYTDNNQISKQSTDECSDVHVGWIREYYCDGDEIDYQDMQCTGAAGCANGVCLHLTCHDVCKWDGIYNAPWGIDSTEAYCMTQGVDRYWKPLSALPQFTDANRGCCCYTLTS